MTGTSFKFSIEPNHPALAGHFPGNPIVPGVVVLDEIIRAVEVQISCNGQRWWVSAVPAVKFLRPLRPGQLCVVDFAQHGQGQLKFTCRSQGEVIATGQLRGSTEPTSRSTQ